MAVLDVPCFVFDLLLPSSHHFQASSASHVTDVMSGCVRLLRALARDNDVIQRSIFDRFEALLAICAIHSDIALLIRDVGLFATLFTKFHKYM